MAPSNRMKKDLPFELLYNFTSAASSALDVQSLMSHFFKMLSTVVDYEIGAFLISHKNRTHGRVYTERGVDKAVVDKFTSYFTRKIINDTPGLSPEKLPRLDVSVLSSKEAGVVPGSSVHTIKVPLQCWGENCGVIALASFGDGKDFGESACTIRIMAEHAGRVLERLFTHIFDEEKKLTNILFSMTEGMYIVNRDGHFNAVNPMGFELVSKFCGNNSECLKSGRCHDEVECTFKDFIGRLVRLGEEVFTSPHTSELKNDSGMILDISACDLTAADRWESGYLITAKDVTDERKMQERILLSSKLASLGEMAAGIAHEINNPLQAILLNIEMLGLNIAEKDKKRLECVEDGITRIKNIVKDLLIFAREETTDTVKVDINTVIEKAVDILRHQMKMANIEVLLDLDDRPLILDCNRNLFQQVIINLLQNSKDAIEGASGSTIAIRTTLLNDTSLTVEVSDDGPGIPEEIKDKVFDPFLTTKDVGKGTGLGLSVSRKIVENMGGRISVESMPRGLTTFKIVLPHCGELMAERRINRNREADYSLLSDKSVLMIDDEAEVLRTVTEALSQYVSKVEPVGESKEAFEKIHASDYDLIFLDIKMPGIDGKELYRQIVEEKPYLADRVIFLSGDTESEKTFEFISATGCRYLSKPFGIKDLLAAMCDTVKQVHLCAKN